MAADLLSQFNRIDLVYKTIGTTSLEAAVLIPQSLVRTPDKSYPILVHIHGGALIVGTNPDPSFLSRWLATLALTTPAVFVSPAYRLIPESTGTDLLADLADFWSWLHTSFPSVLSRHIPDLNVNLGQIAAAGESAGGYLSLQSAFLFPHAQLKVVMASYPAQYPDIKAYNPRREGEGDRDDEAERVIDTYLARIKNGELPGIRVSSPWPEGEGLIKAMTRTGRHREMMGENEALTARGALRMGPGALKGLPAIWVIQGVDDDLVPKAAADELVGLIREASPHTPLKYTVEPGGHTFDLECGIDVPWVKEGIEFVNKYWP